MYPALVMILGLFCLLGVPGIRASAGGEGNSTYNLWIDGRQVDDGNCSDVWNDSVFFFVPESSTLYIYGDHTATTINPVILSDLPSLTVTACANSLLKTENDRKLIQTSGDIQIKGEGDRCGISSNQGKPNSTSTVTIRVTVDYRAVISFCYKAWGENVNYDHGYFMIDGEIYGKRAALKMRTGSRPIITCIRVCTRWNGDTQRIVQSITREIFFAVRDVKLQNMEPVPRQNLSITLDPPVNGSYQAASGKLKPMETDTFSVESAKWYAYTPSEEETEELKQNGYNKLVIDLKPKDGYYFDGTEAFSVNGTAVTSEVQENQHLFMTLYYSFPKYKFTDVNVRLLQWAQKAGIITGYSDGTFRPKDPINRGQMALMLMRYRDSEHLDTTARKDLSGMKDYAEIPSYAREALSWAAAEGLITGRESGTVTAAKAYTQRQECATVIARYINLFFA